VPLVAFEDILEAFFALYPAHAARLAILESLRLLPNVRARLPGNVQQGPRLRLPENVEDEISRSVQADDSGSFLCMDPDSTQRVLATVRRSVEARPDIVSLVVTKPGIRRFARKLIELEFPFLPVLSYDEMLPGRTGSICDMLPSHSG
jgi:type III secretory pathway component EscV